MPSNKNLWVASRIVGLLVLVAPVLSWAQSSLWSDLKSMAEQVVRDKIKSAPEGVANPPPRQPPVSTPATTPVNLPSPYSSGGIPLSATTTSCDAPSVVIDKPSPTCQERWQAAIFRNGGVSNIFFTTNEYIDRWQNGADTSEAFVDSVTTYADWAMFAGSTMRVEDGAAKVALIMFRGNSALLMWGLESPEETLGLVLARESVDTIRSAVEAIVANRLSNPGGVVNPNPIEVATKLVKLSNSLLSYANTVRYSRMRNTYTLALEYLRLLYRMGGDQAAFAQSLGLAPTASVQDCVRAVNKKSFGFPTSLTNASAYDPRFVEKVVNHWVSEISDYAGLKAEGDEIPTVSGQSGLSGDEVAKALGSATEYNRRDAIQRMVEHGAIRSPLSAKETALIVKGTTGVARSQSIAALAKHIKQNLSGQEVETILGSAQDITDYNRRDAIQALAQAGRFGANGADAGLFLDGATGAARAQSIASFAKSLKPNLTGWEAASILGGPDELKEYDRRDAIQALAESKRLRQGLSGDELAAMLNGTTGTARAQSIDALTRRY